MMETKDYVVKAVGHNETRELRLKKLADGNYQLRIYWGKGQRDLATLNFDAKGWAALASFTEGLKRK